MARKIKTEFFILSFFLSFLDLEFMFRLVETVEYCDYEKDCFFGRGECSEILGEKVL